MECKLKCVNFRRVSDPEKVFWLAFRVTGISDDMSWSTMGVIVLGLGIPQTAKGKFGCTWDHLEAPGSAGNKSGSPANCSRAV
jgi:hypothetical protein